MTAVIFNNCNVFDGVGNELLEGHEVAVEGNRIRELADRPIQLANADRIDLGGRTLLPGLIDAHIHVYAIHLDYALTEAMPLTLMSVKALPRLKGMLDRGFTTVRDTAGADFGIKQAVADGLVPGPRLFISGAGITQTGGHGDQRRATDSTDPCPCASALHFTCRIADGVDALRHAVRDELRKGADQIKVMASGGVGSPADPIEGRQFSAEELRAAVDEARAWNTYVCAHSYTAHSTVHALEAGVRSIEHANLIDQEAADLAAERDAFIVPTLVCYGETAKHGDALGVSPVVMEKLHYVNDAGVRMLEYCRRAGVKIGYGTDLVGELHDATQPAVMVATGLCAALVAAAILATWIAPTNPYDLRTLNLLDSLLPPAWVEGGDRRFLLGTDSQGGGILSLIMFGARISLIVGCLAVCVSVFLGMLLGLTAGYIGGRVDAVIMRIADIQFTFPSLLMALLIGGISQSVMSERMRASFAVPVVILALGISHWPHFGRLVRGATLVEKNKDYVAAARLVGRSKLGIMLRHVLPNVLNPVLALATLDIAFAIMGEATLSFLGFGVPPTEPSLGTLIRNGYAYLFSGEWWIVIFPSMTLVILVFAINIIGDWLRDALNPKLR